MKIFLTTLLLIFGVLPGFASPGEDSSSILAIGDNFVYVLSNGGKKLGKYDSATLTLETEVSLNSKARTVEVSGDIPLTTTRKRGSLIVTSYDPTTLASTGEIKISTRGGKSDSGKDDNGKDDSDTSDIGNHDGSKHDGGENHHDN